MLTAILTLGSIATVLALLITLAQKKLRVEEDPRIDELEALLPHVNCGACGYPGCRAFAAALVSHAAQPVQCTVSSSAGHAAIAQLLGVAVGVQEKRVARLACAGGNNVARHRAQYEGIATCAAAERVAGGPKACSWGCIGLGDCAVACTFDAIHMNEHALPVVNEDKCTACGDCVRACPKDLFSIHPISHRLWVPCKNQDAGDVLRAICEVACTACGRCAADAPQLITMHNNLPVIDYSGEHQTQRPIQRCPTGAIVWIEADGTLIKGPAAAAIVRKTALRHTITPHG